MNHTLIGSSCRALLYIIFLASVVGCAPQTPGNYESVSSNTVSSNISLTEPPLILDAREINRSLLRVQITVNGSVSELTQNGVTWTTEINASEGQRLDLLLVWLEGDLELASARNVIESVAGNMTLDIGPEMYDQSLYDEDEDGVSNLAELINGSNPRDSSSPGIENPITTVIPPPVDVDGDGVPDTEDNCVSIANPDQSDMDGDGIGDVCDEPAVVDPPDSDGDGVPDTEDNCVSIANPDQSDMDGNGIGDVCDEPTVVDPPDSDGDGVPDTEDNCVSIANPDQSDMDGDGIGDVCDEPTVVDPPDSDGDGVPDTEDNCVSIANPDQSDMDGDGIGDVCDEPTVVDPPDSDGDGVPDTEDNCVSIANPDQSDMDGDGIGDVCDEPTVVDPPDSDGDGVPDTEDNCVSIANPDQSDMDGDGIGDVCDEPTVVDPPDSDGDGVPDTEDNCVSIANPDQSDMDGNGIGDLCESSTKMSQLKLNRHVRLKSVTPMYVPGGTVLQLSISKQQYLHTSNNRDIITELLDSHGRVLSGQVTTISSGSVNPWAKIEYTTKLFAYGHSGNYTVRVSERVSDDPDSSIALIDTEIDSTASQLNVELNTGTIELVTPIQVEQSFTEQGATKLEFIFSIEERSGFPISAKIFVAVKADNGRVYESVSNSDSWSDNLGSSIFTANKRVQFRIPFEFDKDGEALRSGNYSAIVRAWIFNQSNPDLEPQFEYLDLAPDNLYSDRIGFNLP